MRKILLERQILTLVDDMAQKGKPRQDIQSFLYGVLPESHYGLADNLLSIYFDGASIVPVTGAVGRLSVAAQIVAKSGGAPEHVARAWLALENEGDPMRVGRMATQAVIYGITMLAVLVTVIGVYQIKVLPVFQEFFLDTKTGLPEVTRFFLAPSPAEAAIFLLSLLAVASFSIFVLIFAQSVQAGGSPPSWMRFVPVVKRHAEIFLAYGWLTWRALLGTALSPREAEESATQLAGYSPAAGRLNADWEASIALASYASSRDLLAEVKCAAYEGLNSMVRQSVVLTMITVASLIGVFVVAMYLPIFFAGSGL